MTMRKMLPALSVLLLFIMAAPYGAANDRKALTLDDCIRLARRNNPAIHAAGHNRWAAVYKKKAAVANFLPVFNAEYSHTWLDERPTFEIPAQPGMTIPGGSQDITIDLSSIGLPPMTVPVEFPDVTTPDIPAQQLPAGEGEIDNLTISVTQPLFTGGLIWQGYKLTKLQEKMAMLQAADAGYEITYRTRTTFYGVLKAREFVRVAEKAVEMGESLRKRAQDFYEVGMIAKNQLLEAEVNLAQMQQNLTTARTSYDLARTGLGILIGKNETELVEVQGELEVATIELSLEDCVQNGLRDRPDVRIAQIQNEMARRAVKLERASWVPHVALIGTYTRETGSFSSDEEILSLTIGATWTFWEWGKKYYNVRSSKAMSRAASENLRMVRDMAILGIKQAYLKILQAHANVNTARASLSSAEENLRVVQARFDQQMETSFDVLKAQTLLTQAETNEISAMADYMTAKAELDRAMGLDLAIDQPVPNEAENGTTGGEGNGVESAGNENAEGEDVNNEIEDGNNENDNNENE